MPVILDTAEAESLEVEDLLQSSRPAWTALDRLSKPTKPNQTIDNRKEAAMSLGQANCVISILWMTSPALHILHSTRRCAFKITQQRPGLITNVTLEHVSEATQLLTGCLLCSIYPKFLGLFVLFLINFF